MRKILVPTVIAAILVLSIQFYSSTLFAQASVAFQPRITGLSSPMQVLTAPGNQGRLFIVQKAGTIRIWNGTSLLPTPFLNISGLVEDADEQGLLSMAFHPDYEANGFFFVYYNNNSGNIVVSRYQVSADSNVAIATANPVTPLLNIPKPFTNHNGGHIQFKPDGGTNYLYLATGDGGGSNDQSNNSQDPGSLLGKLLRIDADDLTPTPEIVAVGLRNPFRWSIDRLTGDFWIGDVGQGAKEEVDFLADGSTNANFGWPCWEGTRDNSASAPVGLNCTPVDAVAIPPIFDYDNPPCCGTSIVGGYRYRGTAYPMFQGYYMAAEFFDGRVWFIRSDGIGGWIASAPQTGLPANISSFSEAYNGDSLFATSLATNTVYKIVPTVVTPVILTSFSGFSGTGYNDLKWTTENESDILRYVVEYSTDGINYIEAGSVNSVNNPNPHSYNFRHVITMSGRIQYRLKLVEASGGHNYSAIINLGTRTNNAATVYPTAVTSGHVNVIAGAPIDKIEIMNINGQRVLVRNMNNSTGYFQVALPTLPKGLYYMQISGKDHRQTEKIIIQ